MARIYRNVIADRNTLQLLEQELEANRALLSADENTLTPDHMLFIRSLSPLISSIDPRYNGGDYSLAHKWYLAEDGESDYSEYHDRLLILRSLLRFRRAKIADVGRGHGNPNNPISAEYTVSVVDESLLAPIREAMPLLTEIRNTGEITPQDCEMILEFTPLIDAIDLRYSGINASKLPRGLSIGERWYKAAFWDYEEILPDLPEDCAEFFERFYTLLYSLSRHGIAVVMYSADGQMCYTDSIYPDQP